MKKFAILFLLIFVSFSFAENTAGTVGFQFLKSNVAARPAGMGGAFLSISDDVNALYYNPAGISNISKRTASFTYLNDLLDFNTGFVGLVEPNFGPGNFGISVLFRDYGSFDKTDETGEQLGNFNSNAVSFAGSYGLEPLHNLYVGASAKYLRFSIDTYSADAIAMDAGAMYTIPSQQLTFAVGIFNAGQSLSAFVETKDDLPMSIKAGLSKQLAHLPLLVSFNLYKYNDANWHGALGGEFTLSPNVFLRLGYDDIGRDLKVDSSSDKFAGTAIGLGLVWNSLKIDYSISSYGELGSLNRFTVSGQF